MRKGGHLAIEPEVHPGDRRVFELGGGQADGLQAFERQRADIVVSGSQLAGDAEAAVFNRIDGCTEMKADIAQPLPCGDVIQVGEREPEGIPIS